MPSDYTADDITIIQHACSVVTIRVATLLAAILSTLTLRINKKRTVVAVDGSVYKKNPKMHRLMTDFLEQLLVEHGIQAEDSTYYTKDSSNQPNGSLPAASEKPRTFKIILAEDGSGKGAGLVAAISTKLHLY